MLKELQQGLRRNAKDHERQALVALASLFPKAKTKTYTAYLLRKPQIKKQLRKLLQEEKDRYLLAQFDELNVIYDKLIPSTRKALHIDQQTDLNVFFLYFISKVHEKIKDHYTHSYFASPTLYPRQPMTLEKYGEKVLDKIARETASGADYETVAETIIADLADGGIKVKQPEWEAPQPLDTAAATAYHDEITEQIGKIVEKDMQKKNTRYVEVSAHATARPTHQIWQGQVYYWSQHGEADPSGKYKDFVESTEYGEMLGLLGINCYHTFWAFDPKKDKRTYTDEQLDQFQRGITAQEYAEMEITCDKAKATANALERRMDKYEKIIELRRAAGLKDNIQTLHRWRNTRTYYIDLCRTFELHMDSHYIKASY